jgi:hypothetical protein
MIFSIIHEKTDVMHLWNEAGALQSPNGILEYACPIGTCESHLALVVRMDWYIWW